MAALRVCSRHGSGRRDKAAEATQISRARAELLERLRELRLARVPRALRKEACVVSAVGVCVRVNILKVDSKRGEDRKRSSERARGMHHFKEED